MPSVLFGWELGSGLGHVLRIKRLGARLSARGLRVTAAVKNLAQAPLLTDDGIDILQAPVWPGSIPGASGFEHSSATFGDIMASVGLADPAALTSMLRTWDRLLALTNPDLIVADYAPALMLAARDRVPLAVVGNGFTVPPAELSSFPLLHNVSLPLRSEEQILDTVNSVLRSRQISRLDRLPQLLSSDIRSVQTFPILDPYGDQRAVAVDGPIMAVPEPHRPGSQAIFVYVADRGLRVDVVEALLPLATRLHVYGPGLSASQASALSQAGATIETRPLALETQLAETRLVIHQGGLGVASAALAAGIPQLVLSVDIEKDLNGQALEKAGVGRVIKIHDPAASVSSEYVESLANDDEMSARAIALAGQHRNLLKALDPTTKFETQCLDLLHAA